MQLNLWFDVMGFIIWFSWSAVCWSMFWWLWLQWKKHARNTQEEPGQKTDSNLTLQTIYNARPVDSISQLLWQIQTWTQQLCEIIHCPLLLEDEPTNGCMDAVDDGCIDDGCSWTDANGQLIDVDRWMGGCRMCIWRNYFFSVDHSSFSFQAYWIISVSLLFISRSCDDFQSF